MNFKINSYSILNVYFHSLNSENFFALLSKFHITFCVLGNNSKIAIGISVQFSSVHFSHSVVSDSLWPHEPQHARPPCPSQSWSSLKLMSIESVMPSSYLILCRPLLLLPPVPPSIRVFSNESTLCIRWPRYWSFSFRISLSNEQSGLISFRMD